MRLQIPTTECVAAKELRTKWGENYTLRQWLENPTHLYTGRKGHITVKRDYIAYNESKWHNPFLLVGVHGGTYTMAESLLLYWDHIRSSGLIHQLHELSGLTLGCFCKQKDGQFDCHTKVLVAAFKLYLSNLNVGVDVIAPSIPTAPPPSILAPPPPEGEVCNINVDFIEELDKIMTSQTPSVTTTLQSLTMMRPKERGRVFVGRRIYNGASFTDPKLPGCSSIIVMTKSTAYGSLSPYELRDPKGKIIENCYQFAKAYYTVPAVKEKMSRYNHQVIWEWPAEEHIRRIEDIDPVSGAPIVRHEMTAAYLKWRQAGSTCQYAVRYPVGFNNRHQCLCAFAEDEHGNVDPTPLDYIEGRKRIYVPLYSKAVVEQPQYLQLLGRVLDGENLLIIEVDGPHEETMSYYKEQYGVPDGFIAGNAVQATPRGLELFLNDTKHPYGHGYCLAALLIA